MTAEMSGCNSSIVSLDHAEFAVHGTPPLPRGGSVWIAEPVITFFYFCFFATAIYLYPGNFLSVFWRSNRGSIHYVSGGIGNNLFGGLFALMLWTILQQNEDLEEVCVSLR